ncbi:sigma 54-interacting transcriptional regulator [candidate division KSB1 bacterium]|nr:sigma 54-interacting transcriptional regulator [candidate division KSB1 bacterium]
MKKITLHDSMPGFILISMLILFILFPGGFHSVDTRIIDAFFALRGELPPDSTIVLVMLTDSDVDKLGGWQISRDYYGYLIHILKEQGAKAIGFDLFFGKPGKQFPEHDKMLIEFTKAAGNVIYANYFNELSLTLDSSITNQNHVDLTRVSYEKIGGVSCLYGHPIALPMPGLLDAAWSIGFSNLGEQEPVVRNVPLVVELNGRLFPSYALALLMTYYGADRLEMTQSGYFQLHTPERKIEVPVDPLCRIHINYAGDLNAFRVISFLELLQNYQNQVGLPFLKDKIVLIAPNITGYTHLKAIPMSTASPPVCIHANIIYDVLNRCAFRSIGLLANIGFIILLSLIVFYFQRKFAAVRGLLFSAGSIILYLLCAYFLFSFANTLVAIFAPAVCATLIGITQFIHAQAIERRRLIAEHQLLQNELSAKKTRLRQAEDDLARLQEIEKDQKLYSANIQSQKLKVFQLRSQIHHLEEEFKKEGKRKDAATDAREIIHSPTGKMADILNLVQKIAGEDIAVLITGESGTGKELVARAIHQLSHRSDRQFIAVNCGALPETLLESELFGHEKGSFTGALARRQGRFEQAHGGTLFLDEIGETSQAFQVKLLRVLQEKSFERVGGNSLIKADVRIIAATNKNLKDEANQGKFREDLFYRLNSFPLQIPPLRERKEDIPHLVQHFLRKFCEPNAAFDISEGAMDCILKYQWFGNVRELENAIQRAAILVKTDGRTLMQRSDFLDEIIQSVAATTREKPLGQTIRTTPDDEILTSIRRLNFAHSAIKQISKTLSMDRGTVTERFKGICFKALYEAGWDIEAATQQVVGSDNADAVSRVIKKMETYMRKIRVEIKSRDFDKAKMQVESKYKGLPGHFHQYLDSLILHFIEEQK